MFGFKEGKIYKFNLKNTNNSNINILFAKEIKEIKYGNIHLREFNYLFLDNTKNTCNLLFVGYLGKEEENNKILRFFDGKNFCYKRHDFFSTKQLVEICEL